MIKNYIISIASFSNLDATIVAEVLSTSTLREILFPAHLPLAPGKKLLIESFQDFSVSLLPNSFVDRKHTTIPLFSQSGVEFSADLYHTETVTPNTITIKFTSNHIQEKTITLPILKSLLTEIIPVFKADGASIYDKQPIKISRPNGGHGFKHPEYYQDRNGHNYQISLEWITFYSKKLSDLIGFERFQNLKTYTEKMVLQEGILIILQEEPFDNNSLEHISRKKRAEEELGLSNISC